MTKAAASWPPQIACQGRTPRPHSRATALVHEAYVRLVDANVEWQDRVHFFAVSARMLRRILVDHGQEESNNRQKRGGEFQEDSA